MNDFASRLKDYRVNIAKIKTQKEMAKILNVDDSGYGHIERGDRDPSKSMLKALVNFSGIDEAWWVYGESAKGIKESTNFFSIERMINTLIDEGLLSEPLELTDELKELLIVGLLPDLKLILKKRELDKGKYI